MAIGVGSTVLAKRSSALFWPTTGLSFGLVIAVGSSGAGFWDMIFQDGTLSQNVAEAGLDEIALTGEIVPGSQVRPVGVESGEYDAVVLAGYTRTGSAAYVLLSLIAVRCIMELPLAQVVIVEGQGS